VQRVAEPTDILAGFCTEGGCWLMTAPAPKVDAPALMDFMFRLAQAYLACGEQTALVELFLRRIAAANRMRRSRVVALPTAIFITMHDGTREHVSISEGPQRSLRLDQIAEVYTLGEAAQRGDVDPSDGLERLNEIMRMRPRFNMGLRIFGHVLFTVGLAMVLMPTAANMITAAVLGLFVALLKEVSANRAVLNAPLSVVAAAFVSAAVFIAVRKGLPVDPLHAFVPPLVTFLPGAMLTFGMIELAYGDMVSGASRLMNGFVQLVLLAFGLAAGAALVGYNPADLIVETEQTAVLIGGGWLGVLVFGVGVCLHASAPRNALPWVLFSLILTFEAQRIAAEQFGGLVSGFFGMLVATPLGYLIQLRFKGPPSMVTFLPCFWLLVPGAMGLLSVTRMMTDYSAGIQELINATYIFTSLALGTLVGASLYKFVTESLKLGQMKVGRATRKIVPDPKTPKPDPDGEGDSAETLNAAQPPAGNTGGDA
jgi:uncharacterized membrane protein YjjP (DUF1212 family)